MSIDDAMRKFEQTFSGTQPTFSGPGAVGVAQDAVDNSPRVPGGGIPNTATVNIPSLLGVPLGAKATEPRKGAVQALLDELEGVLTANEHSHATIRCALDRIDGGEPKAESSGSLLNAAVTRIEPPIIERLHAMIAGMRSNAARLSIEAARLDKLV